MICDLVNETISCTMRIVENAGIGISNVDKFLLVGGTSRIPYIRERLETFNLQNLQSNINPELAVSLGAITSLSNTITTQSANANGRTINSNQQHNITTNSIDEKEAKKCKFTKHNAPDWLINQLNNLINKN